MALLIWSKYLVFTVVYIQIFTILMYRISLDLRNDNNVRLPTFLKKISQIVEET